MQSPRNPGGLPLGRSGLGAKLSRGTDDSGVDALTLAKTGPSSSLIPPVRELALKCLVDGLPLPNSKATTLDGISEVGRAAQAADFGEQFVAGAVVWDPAKSAWFSAMAILGLMGGVLTFDWPGLWLFVSSMAFLITFGQSIGMHRLLIHRSFECPKGLEYVLVYLGVLVGSGGPIGISNVHDARDAAQRQRQAHDYFTHKQPFWTDFYWLIHCRFVPRHSWAQLKTASRIDHEPFYRWLERTWMLQQLPLAGFFYLLAGWSGVFLGVCARVAVSIFGHWIVTHLVHRRGPMPYEIAGACVQGHNNRLCALITGGESLHSNHHAFPESCKYSLGPGELDPGWWALRIFRSVGLAWNLKTPNDLPLRYDLIKRPGSSSQAE